MKGFLLQSPKPKPNRRAKVLTWFLLFAIFLGPSTSKGVWNAYGIANIIGKGNSQLFNVFANIIVNGKVNGKFNGVNNGNNKKLNTQIKYIYFKIQISQFCFKVPRRNGSVESGEKNLEQATYELVIWTIISISSIATNAFPPTSVTHPFYVYFADTFP